MTLTIAAAVHGALVLAGDGPARHYVPLCRIAAGANPRFITRP